MSKPLQTPPEAGARGGSRFGARPGTPPRGRLGVAGALIAAALATSIGATGCKRWFGASPPAPSPAAPDAGVGVVALALPDAVPGYAAGPEIREKKFVRRTYARGDARVTVTLAAFAMSPADYERWVKISIDSFPQAPLDLPEGEGNAFLQCEGVEGSRCDLLIQLRAGLHLEVRGEGGATREDTEAVAARLPLRSWAAKARRAGTGGALVLAAAPLGASGAAGGGDSGGSAKTHANPSTQPAPSFRRDVLPTLVHRCAAPGGCHGERPTREVSLDLRAEGAYTALVSRASETRNGVLLVDPHHPARSFLVDKLTGNLAKDEGDRMPLDPDSGSPVPAGTVDAFVWSSVVPWIAAGAAND